LWRIATGLGIGGSVPVAIAMTSEFAPARLRTALVTAMVVCTALGSFAAGIIAPSLEAKFGWHGIFAAGGIFPLAAALLFWIGLPESFRARDVSTENVPSATVTTLLRPPLRHRTVLLWIVFWSNLFVNYSLISWLPTLLGSAGWEKPAAQRATGLLALGGIVGGLTLARLADKGLAFRSLATTYVLVAIVLCLFVLAPPSASGWLPLIALVGAGAFGAAMALGSYCAGFYPAPIRTTGLGWSGGIGRVGSMIGPLVLAGLMSAHIASPAILGLLMIPMVICAICVLLLPGALKDAA
jgi:AAHS family 4-hydroxybenzoate transporter-like MFS transporter